GPESSGRSTVTTGVTRTVTTTMTTTVATSRGAPVQLRHSHGREQRQTFVPRPESRGDHRVPWPRHGGRPRDGEHARLLPRKRDRPQRTLCCRREYLEWRDPRSGCGGQADDRADA